MPTNVLSGCVACSSYDRLNLRFNVTGERYSMRDAGGWNGRNTHPSHFVSQRHGHQDKLLTRQQADGGFSRGELEALTGWKCLSRILVISLILTEH